jgi:hypothetical protein
LVITPTIFVEAIFIPAKLPELRRRSSPSVALCFATIASEEQVQGRNIQAPLQKRMYIRQKAESEVGHISALWKYER